MFHEDALTLGSPMSEDTFLRDRLALQRTELANERTLLAYVRTGIALTAAGASSIHFLGSLWLDALGWALIGAGVVVLVGGGARYRRVRRLLRDAGRLTGS